MSEPKEYIITDDDIHRAIFRLQREGWKPDEAWFNKTFRSRPHTPASEVCEEQDACRIPAMCPEVTLARKHERERVLDELVYWMFDNSICFLGVHYYPKMLAKKLESLRESGDEHP